MRIVFFLHFKIIIFFRGRGRGDKYLAVMFCKYLAVIFNKYLAVISNKYLEVISGVIPDRRLSK